MDSPKLEVVEADFLEARYMTMNELFEGFDELYAITYSSSIGFVCNVLQMFKYAEIIFGFEDIISYSLQEVIAFQSKSMERLRENSNKHQVDLLSRIEEETLKLYVAQKKLSHQKIYILKSDDGRTRVITGSANMSYSAFDGIQKEDIVYFDSDKATDWYHKCFNDLKISSTNEISARALLVGNSDENFEELPISEQVKIKKALVIDTNLTLNQDVQFVFDVKNLAKKITHYMPKPELKSKGRIILSPEKILETKRRIMDGINLEKESRKEYPELVINIQDFEVSLNGKPLDLNPTSLEIKNDVMLFIEYMEGYGKFHGEYQNLQLKYYSFAIWFFSTPFMAIMRNTAYTYNQSSMLYPMFGILYGQSKAGKTTFLETLMKMMIGQKTKLSAPDFTRSSIDGLRKMVKGTPIIVDDLTQQRFAQHAIETIKNDDFGVLEGLTTYPAVVISANEDIKAVSPEVVRRAVVCHVKAGLKNTDLMKTSTVRKVQKNIGTALYREYLRRMIKLLPEMIDELKEDETDSGPDLLNISSNIFYEIFQEYAINQTPKYIRRVSIYDYFNEKETGSQAIKKIREAWQVNPNAFVVDWKFSRLTYNAGETWEADRIVKELPEDLEAHKSRELVVMKLDKAIEFFDIDFRQKSGFWRKLIKF